MSNTRHHEQVKSRNENFVGKTKTRIWLEEGAEDNPYITSDAYCHGYDLLELVKKRSFADVFYLLFRGELPSPEDSEIMEALMIALINPGPRHEATRAAMNAGIGKTDTAHILPIGSSLLGGKYNGAGIIDKSMRFFRKSHNSITKEISKKLTAQLGEKHDENSVEKTCLELVPGFGRTYGGIDILTQKLAGILIGYSGAGESLKWGNQLAQELNDFGIGWRPAGLASAVFSDLGFHPRTGVSLFQLISSPGVAAHGLELANKPITSMPFVKDEDYVLDR